MEELGTKEGTRLRDWFILRLYNAESTAITL
jgi:hypothetical protein